MGCCQDKELYVVCSWDCGNELRTDVASPSGQTNVFNEEDIQVPQVVRAQSVNSRERKEDAHKPPEPVLVEKQPTAKKADAPGTHSGPQETPRAVTKHLKTALFLTGNFAKWATDFAPCRLQEVSCREDVFRLRVCLKLTSQSFSFQVVSAEKQWKWRLYPRDAQNIRFTHVSKEGKLVPGNPDAVVVGLGDLKAGHGLNFHVLESPDTIVTIWVEVPVKPAIEPDMMEVDYTTVAGSKVWYTCEDSGVQYSGGDGVDLNKYSWMGLG